MAVPPVFAIDGVIRHYDWGSTTSIPELLGRPPDGRPAAELWLGAHPGDPSPVPEQGSDLQALITADPDGLLGSAVVQRFGPRLPFLLKVLAAAKPLSIQVHPNLEQARAGFAREDAAGIERDAPQRNYRDANHKPELLWALTPFEALCGFRPPDQIAELFAALRLTPPAEPHDRRALFEALLTDPDPARLVAAVVSRAPSLPNHLRGAARAVAVSAASFPGDVGVLVSLLLNYVCLEPGEAIYLDAGTVHAYLGGTGVELMANSDNVLRCGLTPKHIDVAEVLAITDFGSIADPVRRLRPAGAAAMVAAVPAPDFGLEVFDLARVAGRVDVVRPDPMIYLGITGRATVRVSRTSVDLGPGRAAFVCAGSRLVTLEGTGTLVQASVGADASHLGPAAG